MNQLLACNQSGPFNTGILIMYCVLSPRQLNCIVFRINKNNIIKKIAQGSMNRCDQFQFFVKCRFQFNFRRTKFDVFYSLFYSSIITFVLFVLRTAEQYWKYFKTNGNLIFAFEKLNKTKNQIEKLLNSSAYG